MQIDSKRNNSLSFKQIKINKNEAKKINKLILQYQRDKSSKVYDDLIEAFSPHIEKESAIIAKNKKDRQDLSQDLYLKLIEIFGISDKSKNCSRTIVENLNDFITDIKNIKSVAKKSINKLSNSEYKTLSYEDNFNMPETPKELLDRLIGTTRFRYREKVSRVDFSLPIH